MAYSRALFWNIWGHRVPMGINSSLVRFTSRQSIDVLCLQEVTNMGVIYKPAPAIHTSFNHDEPPSYINGYAQLQEVLGESYKLFFASSHYSRWICEVTGCAYDGVGLGSALIVKQSLHSVAHGAVPFVTNKDDHATARIMQWVVYEKSGRRYLVAHLHGIWIAENTKGDDPRRDAQSYFVCDQLTALMAQYQVSKVIFGGDLNLAIDTKAIRILEQGSAGQTAWVNLIKSYKVEGTRTKRYRKFTLQSESKHADYILVSPSVRVHNLVVDTGNEASDHAPLLVTYE